MGLCLAPLADAPPVPRISPAPKRLRVGAGWLFRRWDVVHLQKLVQYYYTLFRQQVDHQLRLQERSPNVYVPLWPFRKYVEDAYGIYTTLAAVANHFTKWKN